MDKRWKKNGSRPKTQMTGQTTDNFLNWNRINFLLFVSVARNLSLYVIKRSMLVGANIAVKRLRMCECCNELVAKLSPTLQTTTQVTKSWCLLGYALGAKCLKVFFPYLCFLLQICSNFSILFVSSKGQRFCLTFPFEILRGKFARGPPESIPTRMPNVWPLCCWSQRSILAACSSRQKSLSRANATRDPF